MSAENGNGFGKKDKLIGQGLLGVTRDLDGKVKLDAALIAVKEGYEDAAVESLNQTFGTDLQIAASATVPASESRRGNVYSFSGDWRGSKWQPDSPFERKRKERQAHSSTLPIIVDKKGGRC